MEQRLAEERKEATAQKESSALTYYKERTRDSIISLKNIRQRDTAHATATMHDATAKTHSLSRKMGRFGDFGELDVQKMVTQLSTITEGMKRV
jgi:hypothetical protein